MSAVSLPTRTTPRSKGSYYPVHHRAMALTRRSHWYKCQSPIFGRGVSSCQPRRLRGLMASVPRPQVEIIPSAVRSSLAEDFSVIRGGPGYWLQVRLGVADEERRGIAFRALVLVLVCWFPLLILSFTEGLAYGHGLQIPFLEDFAVNV